MAQGREGKKNCVLKGKHGVSRGQKKNATKKEKTAGLNNGTGRKRGERGKKTGPEIPVNVKKEGHSQKRTGHHPLRKEQREGSYRRGKCIWKRPKKKIRE